MSITGAIAGSFFNPADGTVVQFNHIGPDSEFYHNGTGEQDIKGNQLFAGDESRLALQVADTAGLDQIRTWQDNGTEIQFVLAGKQFNILWYEPCTVQIQEPKNFAAGSRRFVTIIMEKEGGIHKIWSGVNLRHGINIINNLPGWADEDGDEVADGYQVAGGGNQEDFSPGFTQFLNTNNAQTARVQQSEIIFPVAGVKLTSSLFVVTLDSSGVARTNIFFSDYNQVDLSSDQIEITTISERTSVRIQTPESMYSLIVSGSRNTIMGGKHDVMGQFGFRYPALRTGGSDQYVAG